MFLKLQVFEQTSSSVWPALEEDLVTTDVGKDQKTSTLITVVRHKVKEHL